MGLVAKILVFLMLCFKPAFLFYWFYKENNVQRINYMSFYYSLKKEIVFSLKKYLNIIMIANLNY